MVDAILIIDISKDSVRAGVFSASKTDPLEYFSVPLSGPEAHAVTEGVKEGLSSVVSMVKGKGYGITRALASIPASDMSIRIVTVPFEDRKKITEVLPFELGGLLHIDVEHVVIDAIHIGEGKVLAVALEKALLKDYLDAFHSLGIDPYWIGSGLFALPALLNRIYPSSGIKAFINRDSLTISEDGNIRFFKPVKRLEGIKLGLAYIDAEGIGINEVYFTGWRISSTSE
ncbi:MAG: hypothetical protein HY954_12760, partial [Deltaproteobacteria bacterium]|nr:hypothetical protein [Deltaproteobacteria bacterium]